MSRPGHEETGPSIECVVALCGVARMTARTREIHGTAVAGSPPHRRKELMPSDETRHLLRAFGVAVTAFEDAVRERSSTEAIQKSQADVQARLEQIIALIARLRADAASVSN
jgi:hypothetical protein